MPKDSIPQSGVINSCNMLANFPMYHCHGMLSLAEKKQFPHFFILTLLLPSKLWPLQFQSLSKSSLSGDHCVVVGSGRAAGGCWVCDFVYWLVHREKLMSLNDNRKDSGHEQRKPSWLHRITSTHGHWQYRAPFLKISGSEIFSVQY